MLAWILGIENSFTKSLLYVTFLGSAITVVGSLIYLVMVGLPLKLAKASN